MKYAVAIDIGGTNTRVALVNEKLEITDRQQFSTNPENPEETLGKIAEVINRTAPFFEGGKCVVQGEGIVRFWKGWCGRCDNPSVLRQIRLRGY